MTVVSTSPRSRRVTHVAGRLAVVVMSSVFALVACGRIGFDARSNGVPADAAQFPDGKLVVDAPRDAPPDVQAVNCVGTCVCDPNDCDLTCGSAGCNVRCASGANCNVTCDQAPCHVDCEGGANCHLQCGAGGCTATVSGGGDLKETCTQGCQNTCPASAGSCIDTCDQPATCTCSGSGCP